MIAGDGSSAIDLVHGGFVARNGAFDAGGLARRLASIIAVAGPRCYGRLSSSAMISPIARYCIITRSERANAPPTTTRTKAAAPTI